ncbi:hypothetical protein HN681_00160 [archaeon]|jgi:hypothetical protein|nr:hypothetical protein [archaeon]MBT3730501.1 hypothetical protein [archaeon]MBT4669433.1 hypothetical protein [archaeon]MBT5029814.1 hypothetical protein [archaeon]MBT5288027.1 hypothetical protein [archaeon]
MKKIILSLIIFVVLVISFTSAEIFVDENTIAHVYESVSDDSFSVYLTDLDGNDACGSEKDDSIFSSGGFDTLGNFYFDSVTSDGVHSTSKINFDPCEEVEIYSEEPGVVQVARSAVSDSCRGDNDCDSDAACVTDGTEGHLGECVVCIESDDGSDYETAGTISQGVWKTNGEYYSGGSDSCQSSTHLKELRCSVDGSSGKAFAFYTARSCSDAVGENSVCLEDEEGRGYCSPGSEDTMVRNENLDRAPEQKEKGFFGRVLDKLRP